MLKQPFFSQLATESAERALSRMKIYKVLMTTNKSRSFRCAELHKGCETYSDPWSQVKTSGPCGSLIKEIQGNFGHWGGVSVLESIQVVAEKGKAVRIVGDKIINLHPPFAEL